MTCCVLPAPPWTATGRPATSELRQLPQAPNGIQRKRLLQSNEVCCLRLLTSSLISCFAPLVSPDKASSAKAEKVIHHTPRQGVIPALPLCCVTESKSLCLSEPQCSLLQHGVLTAPASQGGVGHMVGTRRSLAAPIRCQPRQPGERNTDGHVPYMLLSVHFMLGPFQPQPPFLPVRP